MKAHKIEGQKRTEVGKRVKDIRKRGLTPATVYGKKLESLNISLTSSDFDTVYAAAGETGLIELTVDGKTLPVLIHHVQKDPVKDTVLHAEFYQVDLKEKVKTNVPIAAVNESPAVAQKIGVLLTILSEVEVEALPTDLPERIDVDVSMLTELGQEIKVSELKAPHGVTILADKDLSVMKIDALVSKEAEEQVAQDAAAAAEAVAPAEGESSADTTANEPSAATPEEKSEE